MIDILKSALAIFGLYQRRAHETQVESRGANKVKQATTEAAVERMKRAKKHRDTHRNDTPDDILKRMRASARRKGDG